MLRWMTIVRPEVAMKNFSTRRTTFLTGFFGGGFAGLMGVGGGVVAGGGELSAVLLCAETLQLSGKFSTPSSALLH